MLIPTKFPLSQHHRTAEKPYREPVGAEVHQNGYGWADSTGGYEEMHHIVG